MRTNHVLPRAMTRTAREGFGDRADESADVIISGHVLGSLEACNDYSFTIGTLEGPRLGSDECSGKDAYYVYVLMRKI